MHITTTSHPYYGDFPTLTVNGRTTVFMCGHRFTINTGNAILACEEAYDWGWSLACEEEANLHYAQAEPEPKPEPEPEPSEEDLLRWGFEPRNVTNDIPF